VDVPFPPPTEHKAASTEIPLPEPSAHSGPGIRNKEGVLLEDARLTPLRPSSPVYEGPRYLLPTFGVAPHAAMGGHAPSEFRRRVAGPAGTQADAEGVSTSGGAPIHGPPLPPDMALTEPGDRPVLQPGQEYHDYLVPSFGVAPKGESPGSP
jgi:hypothetical protein